MDAFGVLIVAEAREELLWRQKGCYAEGPNVQGDDDATPSSPAEVMLVCLCGRESNRGEGEADGDDHDEHQ